MYTKIAAVFVLAALFLPAIVDQATAATLRPDPNTVLPTAPSASVTDSSGPPTPKGMKAKSSGSACAQLTSNLARGTRSSQVSALQAFLTSHYNILDDSLLGGYFGALTQKYLTLFQKEQGLPATGYFGPMTRAVIAKQCGVTTTTTQTSGNKPTGTVPAAPSATSKPTSQTGAGASGTTHSTDGGDASLPPSAKECISKNASADLTFTETSSGVFTVKDNNGSTLNSNGGLLTCVLLEQFYKTHADAYEFLHVITNAQTMYSGERGYNGSNATVNGPAGKGGRLSSFITVSVQDNALFLTSDTDAQQLLLHEAGHNWLAFIDFSSIHKVLTGETMHYPELLDTATRAGGKVYYDPMGGAPYTDNGDGTFTITFKSDGSRFSPLSLYFMGLVPASQVGTMSYWVPTGTTGFVQGCANCGGANLTIAEVNTVKGTKGTVTVSDIAALGRTPKVLYPNAQTTYHTAFLIVPKYGSSISSDVLTKVQRAIDAFPASWYAATNGLSTMVVGPAQ